MPSTINLYQIGVWFCVAFLRAAGWAIVRLACWSNSVVLKRPGNSVLSYSRPLTR